MTHVTQFTEVAMEAYIETVSVGGMVTARIVLQGNSFIKEIARVSLTQAHWEDLRNCLLRPARLKREKVVFALLQKEDAQPAQESASTVLAYSTNID
jgi:hypothetical protein